MALMKSMTGYGSSRVNIAGLELEVSVRTVNGRYLDVRTHLPKDFISVEPALKDLAKKTFQRGAVDIFVQVPSSSSGDFSAAGFDLEMVKLWRQKASELKKKVKIEGDLSFDVLVTLPGVVKVSKGLSLNPDDKGHLLKVCEQALLDCEKFRVREGKSIGATIKGHLSQLQKIVGEIESLQAQFEKNMIKKLKVDMDSVNLETVNSEELKMQMQTKINEILEKINIQEETSRLTQHIGAAQDLLKAKESIGKKLDFFAQEFLREMNTIGSKCQNAEITGLVITGKSAIESFREQVQNIE